MGVDAKIYVKTGSRLPDEEVQELSRRVGDAFGAGCFYGGPVFFDRDEGDNFGIGESDRLLRAKTFWRYYGPGYERGPLHDILALCDFLRSALPGSVVYYGGDSGIGLKEYTPVVREELWLHFVENGHRSYLRPRQENTCPRCCGPMWRSGFSRGRDMYSCAGCGYSDWESEECN